MGAVGRGVGHIVRIVLILASFGCVMGQTDPCGTDRPLVTQGYTGTFSSLNYPNKYPSGKICSWRVVSTVPEKQLWLVFNRTFDIEEFGNSCGYDYLQVHDGPSGNFPLIKTLCGDTAPEPIVLSGNEVFVKFVTDAAVRKIGFSITWRTCPPHLLMCDEGSVCVRGADQCDMQQHCQDYKDEINCDHHQTPCGGQILTDNGNITTVNYPVFFPPGLSCTWNIVAAPGKRLRASFTGIFDVPCLSSVKVIEVDPNGNELESEDTSTFCGSQTPPDVIVTDKERLKIDFQPPMAIPGKGFALTWETSCQEDYFLCSEGSCIVPEKVCNGADDCQQGEDESEFLCADTTASPSTTPIVTTYAATSDVDRTPTPTHEAVTPWNWHNYTTAVGKGIPNASAPTPHWTGSLADSTVFTALPSDDYSIDNIDTYPSRQCYSCHDDGACASPVDSAVPVSECLDDQDCWVERILGPGRQKERIVYRRGCGSLCPEYWEQEDCMDGWVQVCKVCCSEDLCNSQLLNGDDKRFSNQVSEPNMVGVLQPNWIHLLAASLSTVCVFTA
ncbi:tolloid-like protein 1 [Branchiostoma floridae x Branchiostoma belcheri]